MSDELTPLAAPTERPTCATCPCFDKELNRSGYAPKVEGECLLLPTPVHKAGTDSCSHHPDFPAWIASRRAGT
jgi:hypothetical protein